MKRVEGKDYDKIRPFIKMAAEQAKKATCLRAMCGTVIVKNGEVIGEGYNSPPLNDESQRVCNIEKDFTKKPKYDKTCCVHAEWRAILDASKRNADKLPGSTLYFTRVDDSGNFIDSGDPFCTVCSRLTMEVCVSKVVLHNKNGADIYKAKEYNNKSYEPYLVQ